MGNIFSGASVNQPTRHRSPQSESETMESKSDSNIINNGEEQYHDSISDDEEARARHKEEEMTAFRKQLDFKREQRREILAKHKSDKRMLENALEEERKSKLDLFEQNKLLRDLLQRNNIEIPENLQSNENCLFKEALEQLSQDIESLKENNNKLRCDLAKSNSALQSAYSDVADLNAQNTESIKQIKALKEVITVSKTLISLREDQLTELKNKLAEIEQSLADREASMLSTDLRQEYERQLQNIRTLRGLYEERARLAEVTRQALARELDEHKALLQTETARCSTLSSEVEELKGKICELEESLEEKNTEIASTKDEMIAIKSEMMAINKLFSQVLLGYKKKRDLDSLVKRLEENHGILTQMAEQENGNETSSALPKLLLELVNQVDDTTEDTGEKDEANTSFEQTDDESSKVEEIVQNLPRVWKVLMELLSHQTQTTTNESEKVTTCYKSVETKSGPVLVPSVSQTYIRLKDLIIEKLSLIKEVNRMKQLNTHLETRLQEQERRLCLVTTELSKTWHVVGRLRRHHHQLHTHEKILKYELQQKRKLINELKEDLEYCREKWEQAREKNAQSEKDWKKLRAEFATRKLKDSIGFSNSAESGYSDERPSDESSESNDESECVQETKLKCKKKSKKSFETAIDSSADFNLTAEREDPVSDMVDVADLSLDTQDENQEAFDDSCNSESILKSDKALCDETEDEAAEISNDGCTEEFDNIMTNSKVIIGDTDTVEIPVLNSTSFEIIIENKNSRPNSPNEIKRDSNPEVNTINVSTAPSTSQQQNKVLMLREENDTINSDSKFSLILENIKKQDEHLKKKDKRLDELESKCAEVVTNLTNTIQIGQVMNEKLNDLHVKHCADNIVESNLGTKTGTFTHKESDAGPSAVPIIPEIDLKTIRENIQKQNEHLKRKDEKLTNLENSCAEVVATLKNVVITGDKILNDIHSARDQPTESLTISEDILNNQSTVADNMLTEMAEFDEQDNEHKLDEGASTSHEIDHEARFAARDLRLKRLEEQTKSLVSKVNDTTTKGVKIHYKLEELHNIYGSDHSRSGTPSEETGECSHSNDDETNNEN